MKTLRGKILIGFFIMIALVLVMGMSHFIASNLSNQKTQKVVSTDLPLLNIYDELNFNMNERTSLVRGYLLYELPAYYNAYDSATEQMRELETELLTLSTDSTTQELIDRIHAWDKLVDHQVFVHYDKGNKELAIDTFSCYYRRNFCRN